MKQFFKKCYLAIILIFLYIPIVVLICQSFNAGKSRAKWEGFSFHWYEQLFSNSSSMSALWVTVSIAVIATIVATDGDFELVCMPVKAEKVRPVNYRGGGRRAAPG